MIHTGKLMYQLIQVKIRKFHAHSSYVKIDALRCLVLFVFVLYSVVFFYTYI